jgi:hypothetical protein
MQKLTTGMTFISPSKGRVTVDQMVRQVTRFVDDEPNELYRLVIGTDSQTKRINGQSEITFVSAVVVHRQGRGGKYFWRKQKVIKKPVLRDKIYTETLMSLNLAQDIVPKLRKQISAAKYDLEIHIDVGALGPTRDMIKEVVGMVNGNGFVAKTKPDSWGASSVADKHT